MPAAKGRRRELPKLNHGRCGDALDRPTLFQFYRWPQLLPKDLALVSPALQLLRLVVSKLPKYRPPALHGAARRRLSGIPPEKALRACDVRQFFQTGANPSPPVDAHPW